MRCTIESFVTGSHLLEVQIRRHQHRVLICSSLTMALAIRSAQTGKRKGQIIFWLILTMIFGALFLGLKLRFEWYRDYIDGIVPGINWAYNGPHAPGVQMFMCFYFFMTGLHALHMVVGLGVLTVLVIMTARNKFSPEYYAPLEISGLYWHFVDIVWIFLFALLYLIGGRYALGERSLMSEHTDSAIRARGAGQHLRLGFLRLDGGHCAHDGGGLH